MQRFLRSISATLVLALALSMSNPAAFPSSGRRKEASWTRRLVDPPGAGARYPEPALPSLVDFPSPPSLV
jgi:hypothetical protein